LRHCGDLYRHVARAPAGGVAGAGSGAARRAPRAAEEAALTEANMPLRVVQWTTGNVGRRALLAIAANPELELIGCYAWSADKVGRDAGELAGIEKLGVAATNDVDSLLELRPDCVSDTPDPKSTRLKS